MRVAGCIVLIFAAISACRERKEVAVPAPPTVVTDSVRVVSTIDTAVYYERTACFGMCPIFTCVILSNGSAVYEGRNFVDRIGQFQTNMDPTALQMIYQQCEAIDYFSLKPIYDHEHVTDLPSVITIIQVGEKKTKVVNRYKGPKALNDVYNALDTLIAQAKWVQMVEEKK